MSSFIVEYAPVIRIVRFKNKRGTTLKMRVRNCDERARRARRNQQLQRRRFRIDLDVIEPRNLLRNSFP